MLNVISQECKKEEDEAFENLYSCIDSKTSAVFNAGAGSGKTYALVECLKYICIQYGNMLKRNNQFVICITYTNVAANEIRERLGNNSVVKVSTIHERVWDFIKEYQHELVAVHAEYLAEQIIELNDKMVEEKEFQKYKELSENDKKKFLQVMISHKEEFYQAYDFSSADFKKVINVFATEFSDMLKNVNNFKKIVNTLFNIDNYEKCLASIKNNVKGYQTVVYDV